MSRLESLRSNTAGVERPALPTRAPATMTVVAERIRAALEAAPKLLDDERASRVVYQGSMVLARFDAVAQSTSAWRAANRLEAAQRVITSFVSTLRWCSSSAEWEVIANELAGELEALRERMDELRRRERSLQSDIHQLRSE